MLKIYFYCCEAGPPERTAYQHGLVCLAEGLQELGQPFYANIDCWPLTPGREAYLFRHDPHIEPEDCDVVVLDHSWTVYGRTLPPAVLQPRRRFAVVYVDHADGVYTPAWQPPICDFDWILRPHSNERFAYPARFVPWAFGLSSRILQALPGLPQFETRKRPVLSNYRSTHPLRQLANSLFLPRLRSLLTIDATVEALAPPEASADHRLQWEQTGRRHDPRYYARLLGSTACACFGGLLQPPLIGNTPLLHWWDSWRFWEALAAGSVAFHADFEKYGAALPVMPQNWQHYIGIDFDNLQPAIERLMDEPEILETISNRGRQWAIAHYAPLPVARRLLALLES